MNNKIINFIEYFQYLKNPIEVLQFKFGIKKECNLKIKQSNFSIYLNDVTILNRLMNILPITQKEKYPEFINYFEELSNNQEIVDIDDIKYVNILNDDFIKTHPYDYAICIEEYFTGDQWDMINFKNRNIIDIGANNADTALYFAKNGANVIAFEPVKHLYELGLENIEINPDLKDNIQLINKAVGTKRGKLDITANSMQTFINDKDSYQIEVITIEDIINDYNFPCDILKMDCEGCEFKIILTQDLSMFNEIIFEHHAFLVKQDYKPLIKRLEEQNFKINTYPCNASKRPFEKIGIIHAYK